MNKMTKAEADTIRNELINSLTARIAVATEARDRSANFPGLRRAVWVVVSSRWNGRGAYAGKRQADGGTPIMIGPFPGNMPCLFDRDTAESLAKIETEAGAEREANNPGAGESFSIVHETAWWETERAEAVLTLASIPKGAA